MKTLQDPKKIEKVGSFYEMNTKANQDYIEFWKEQLGLLGSLNIHNSSGYFLD
jgi:hypothetical protein